MTKISIVIATWNAGKTLQTCLDSIVSQLTTECELIIIDGESTDNTNQIIRSYGDKINYTLSEKDKGIYDAWNKGINASKGQWICFIGADDVLYPDAIDTYLNVINETPEIDTYDYISAQNDFVDEEGRITRVIGTSASWANMRRGNGVAHVGSLHNKKNLFDTIGGYDLRYRISADYELLVRKKDKLNYLYIPNHIAKMKIGGMSFSSAALVEVFRIRKQHSTISMPYNIYLFLKNYVALKTFRLRKRFFKL